MGGPEREPLALLLELGISVVSPEQSALRMSDHHLTDTLGNRQ
jgi:hypothetical protein